MAAPKLAGRVVTQFDISPKGAVISANVRNSDVQSKTLESCLVEVVKQMAFPEAPTGVGTRVIYPFVFQARSN
jgi:TonB family protein